MARIADAGLGRPCRSGLRQKNSGGHGESGLFLTGNPHFNGGKLTLTGNTISIDQHIAAARGHEASIPSLVLSVAGGQDTISWDARGHSLSVKNEADTPLEAEYLANIDRYWVGKLARFLDRLAAIDHDGASLLDHTVVMFGSGMSWGNHNPDHLPLLIAGGSKLGIKHLGHVGYNDHAPADEQRPKTNASDLLRTISEVCGVPAVGFGDSTRVIDELLA